MPSPEAEAALAMVTKLYAPRRHRPLAGALEDVRDATSINDQPDPLPDSVMDNVNIHVEQESFRPGPGSEWIVRHMSRVENPSSSAVIVYWHGGSFVTKASTIGSNTKKKRRKLTPRATDRRTRITGCSFKPWCRRQVSHAYYPITPKLP